MTTLGDKKRAIYQDVAQQAVRENGSAVAALCQRGYEPRFLKAVGAVGTRKYICTLHDARQFRQKIGVVGYGASPELAALEALVFDIVNRHPITDDML